MESEIRSGCRVLMEGPVSPVHLWLGFGCDLWGAWCCIQGFCPWELVGFITGSRAQEWG